ncbi:MAG: T9SS type A sorting domain-containing protein [Cyclobacteriaceae bacterium]
MLRFRLFVCIAGFLSHMLVSQMLGATAMSEMKSNNPVDQDATVYPNPATSHLFVRTDRLPFPALSDYDLSIKVVNILGNTMKTSVELIDNRTYRIDLSQSPAGYYMLIVQCSNCPDTNKAIIRFQKQ